jgi:hypothetical protein
MIYHSEIDGGDAGIEKYIGGTPPVPPSRLKITKHHRHSPYRCCS